LTILTEDFDLVVASQTQDVEILVNSNVVLTGGTGFVGKWIVGSWIAGCRLLGGKGRLLVASRDPTSILKAFPELSSSNRIEFVASDIRSLEIDRSFRPNILIHGATAASEKLNVDHPIEMIDVIVTGTRRAMQVARHCGVSKVVYLSSGAVYGHESIGVESFIENQKSAPDITNRRNAYHEAKRLAELLVLIESEEIGLEAVSLRMFAFLAPFLPQNSHFAAGVFLHQALRGQDITISSGGGSVRSYQYGVDLARFIICAASRQLKHPTYNIGSEEAVSILDLAKLVRDLVSPNSDVVIAGYDSVDNLSFYVPNIRRAVTEFGIENFFDLATAVERTARWGKSEDMC
jgi:UDP-glucuronate decarboxylase